MLDRRGNTGSVVLGVPAVAQHHERYAGIADQGFGGKVLGGKAEGGGIGAQQAGVGQQFHTRVPGRFDDRAMLVDALSDLA